MYVLYLMVFASNETFWKRVRQISSLFQRYKLFLYARLCFKGHLNLQTPEGKITPKIISSAPDSTLLTSPYADF